MGWRGGVGRFNRAAKTRESTSLASQTSLPDANVMFRYIADFRADLGRSSRLLVDPIRLPNLESLGGEQPQVLTRHLSIHHALLLPNETTIVERTNLTDSITVPRGHPTVVAESNDISRVFPERFNLTNPPAGRAGAFRGLGGRGNACAILSNLRAGDLARPRAKCYSPQEQPSRRNSVETS